MAHASAFPTATNTFRGSRKRSFGDTSLLPFPSLSVAPAGSTIAMATTDGDAKVVRRSAVTTAPPRDDGGRGGSGGVENAIFTVRPLYLPSGHPPLSREVYEHVSAPRLSICFEHTQFLSVHATSLPVSPLNVIHSVIHDRRQLSSKSSQKLFRTREKRFF